MKHWMQALSEFLGRYREAFRQAWGDRHRHISPPRSRDEVEFLPAHLELIETPVSPFSRILMWSIVVMFVVALLWACLGRLDIVAKAPGNTVVSSRTKVIQPSETAVVRSIHVRDGAHVRRGDLLVELDGTLTEADARKVETGLLAERLNVLRLEALLEAFTNGRPPQLQTADGITPAQQQQAQAMADAQYQSQLSSSSALKASIEQRSSEAATINAMLGPLAENAEISRARAADYAGLLEGRYVSRHEYLLREQERISAENELSTQRNRLHESQSAIANATQELSALKASVAEQVLFDLKQAREQVAQLEADNIKAVQRNRLMQLRAPVDGRVQQLAIHTVGGVVTPAQELMAVVPDDDGLEVEVTVLNTDIGFIRQGQPAVLKLDSYPFTRYGYLEGEVVSVSTDAAQDEKLGLVFPVRIRLGNGNLNRNGRPLRLSAGMSLTAEIMTGRRRVIDYLLSPLRENMDAAGNER